MADNGKSMAFTVTLDAEAQAWLAEVMAALPPRDKEGRLVSITPQVACREALKRTAKAVRR